MMGDLNSPNYLVLVTTITNKEKLPSLDKVCSMMRMHERQIMRMDSIDVQLVQANFAQNNSCNSKDIPPSSHHYGGICRMNCIDHTNIIQYSNSQNSYYPIPNANNQSYLSQPMHSYPLQPTSKYEGTCQIYKNVEHSAQHCRFRYVTKLPP